MKTTHIWNFRNKVDSNLGGPAKSQMVVLRDNMLISLILKRVIFSTCSQDLTEPMLITLQQAEHDKRKTEKHILPIALADPMRQC